jgi:hypothetical protein
VFAAKRHLDDSALIHRYLADRGIEALEVNDEALLRHLVQCAACEARYVALQAAFEATRDAAIAQADEALSASRLATQRDRILRRIDAQYAGPRVLAFPAAGQAAATTRQPHLVRRWIAAAAVAGLVIGLTAGRLLQFGAGSQEASMRRPATAAGAGSARTTPVMRSVHAEPPVDENAFLSEVDLATASPRAAELRAIYAFTIEESRDVPPRTRKN